MNFKKAFELRKSHQFRDAIEIYQNLWLNEPEKFNEWDGWSYAWCLSKMNRHQEALEICRQLYPRFKNVEILNTLYAKCIYYTQFDFQTSTTLPVLQKAVQAMYQLSPPHTPYSFTTRAIFKLIKRLMEQQSIDWKGIETWLEKMDPDLLDNNPWEITNTKGKSMQLASPREEWYANMIRVKGGLKQPLELLKILETARKQNIKWHYNNDIWFARKEAFALRELGKNSEAEKILRKIVNQKREWFLLLDLAETVGNKDEQLQLMSEAALAPGKREMKIKLYVALQKLLKDKHPNESALLFCLVAAIREENDWPVQTGFRDEAVKMGIDPDKVVSSTVIIEKLTPFWKKFIAVRKRMNGIVDIIFSNNKSGFIKTGNQKYFFKTGKLEGKIKPGDKVVFEVINSYDQKKKRMGMMAIKIEVV
ncbi:MAG: hypothetical protein JST21_01440 [Bacteroidetes bacterium]|nr:hypothetical protein [Bacteroidota bacterium]